MLFWRYCSGGFPDRRLLNKNLISISKPQVQQNGQDNKDVCRFVCKDDADNSFLKKSEVKRSMQQPGTKPETGNNGRISMQKVWKGKNATSKFTNLQGKTTYPKQLNQLKTSQLCSSPMEMHDSVSVFLLPAYAHFLYIAVKLLGLDWLWLCALSS